jgi:hypothetical protein
MEYRLDITHPSHSYLDGYFSVGRVLVNGRRDGEPRVGSKEDFVCAVWETMWLERIPLWFQTAGRQVKR